MLFLSPARRHGTWLLVRLDAQKVGSRPLRALFLGAAGMLIRTVAATRCAIIGRQLQASAGQRQLLRLVRNNRRDQGHVIAWYQCACEANLGQSEGQLQVA